MSRTFRFVVYGVRKGVPVDAITGTAEKEFSSLQRGFDWVVSVSKFPDYPAYSVHTWNDAEQAMWAVTIQPNWAYRFVCC
jgi:hypothetical protein